MPYVRVDLACDPGPDLRRRLLTDLAELFAEVTESPIERVRTQVVVLGPDAFAVGGVPIAAPADEAPFVTIALLQGRPATQHQALIERTGPCVAELLGVPLGRVRVWIHEVPPDLWGIGGASAAEQRAAEIAARR
ncbi:MAG TPA: tautomerase family protein [Ilumatobacter sp.]|nr:tautomerase family protein [Ilumatobacter sp.]